MLLLKLAAWFIHHEVNSSKADPYEINNRKLRGALEAWDAHSQRRLEEREKLADPWRDYELVFCVHVGTPLNRNNVHTRFFKPLVERAGLPPPYASTTSDTASRR